MKAWIWSAVCLICAAAAVECWSQENSTVVVDATVATAEGLDVTKVNPPASSMGAGLHVAPGAIAGAGVSSVRVTIPRVADKKFFLLNGLEAGMAVFDVEMTQHCIAARKCREANPVMPSSHIGQLSVNFALLACESWYSYWLKKHHTRVWWVPPLAGTMVHSVGVATGFENY